MMLIICKLYVWIHITWEAYVIVNVYWNNWLLIAPPECSLPDSQRVEVSLKIKTVSSGELHEWLNAISCHWSSPSSLKCARNRGVQAQTWCVLAMASLNQFFSVKTHRQGFRGYSWSLAGRVRASQKWLTSWREATPPLPHTQGNRGPLRPEGGLHIDLVITSATCQGI